MKIENTACILVQDKEGRILLVKRANRTFHGWWCLPGGHSEKGETAYQNVQREANEEVGAVKVERKPFMVFLHDWPADSHTPELHKHNCHAFRAKVSGALKAGDDAEEPRWFTLDEAKKLKMTVYTQRVLESLEPFVIVDENDNVIGQATRGECHSGKKIIHRAASIIIMNSRGEILAQKRSALKDTDPGRWTMSVGGHLQPGESYEDGAAREVAEEIGVKCRLKFLFNILVETKVEREMLSVFSCNHEGPFKINKEEVDEIKFMPKSKVLEMTRNGELTEFDVQYMRKFFGIS